METLGNSLGEGWDQWVRLSGEEQLLCKNKDLNSDLQFPSENQSWVWVMIGENRRIVGLAVCQ